MPPRARARPTAVVLAAGLSSRFGGAAKQAATLGGSTLLARVVGAVPAGMVEDEVVVVVGHRAREVVSALPPGTKVRFVTNHRYREGMGSSIRAGVSSLRRGRGADGVLILLADQPFVTSRFLARMLRARAAAPPGAIVAASHGGVVSPPVIFPKSLVPELRRLAGDRGAKSVISGHPGSLVLVATRSRRLLLDLDTARDLEEARKLLHGA